MILGRLKSRKQTNSMTRQIAGKFAEKKCKSVLIFNEKKGVGDSDSNVFHIRIVEISNLH